MKHVRASRGFTLVELLIVIVVIAILAAITIVAYGGVTSKAQAAQLQSDLSQARTFMESYFVQNGQYPADLTTAEAAGLKLTTPDSNLIYSVNNTANPATWGLTAVNGSQSYYVNNTSQPTAKTGVWITNLAVDPRATSSGYEWASRYSNSSTWVTGASDGPTAALTSYVRKSITAAVTASGRGIDIHGNLDVTSDSDDAIPVSAGVTYFVSVYMRSSESNTGALLECKTHDSTGAWGGSNTPSTTVAYTANTWIHPSITITPTADGYLACTARMNGSTAWVVGDTMDATGLMIAPIVSPTTSYNYADGQTAGWSWNGAQYTSTSSGPAV